MISFRGDRYHITIAFASSLLCVKQRRTRLSSRTASWCATQPEDASHPVRVARLRCGLSDGSPFPRHDSNAGTASEKSTFLTWRDVHALANTLADHVLEAEGSREDRRFGYDLLLGITRGGLVPCALLAQRFELRNILTATVLFYDDSGERFYGVVEPRMLTFPEAHLVEGKRVLVVDDVFDSGRTARAVKMRCERARATVVDVAVLHYKPENNQFGNASAPRFFAQTVKGSDWIVYPWERWGSSGQPHESISVPSSVGDV